MPHANPSTHADDLSEPDTQTSPDTEFDCLSAGGRAATQRILKKYAPIFEHARQTCHTHLRAHDYAALVREVTWMAKLDDALINDLCLMTDQSPQHAQPYRQIRRSDIELLRFAASRSGNTAASLRADQLMRSVREISLQALSELMHAKPSDAVRDESLRDDNGGAAGLGTIKEAPSLQVVERRKR